MIFQLTELEYNVFLILTLVLVAFKLGLIIFLGKKIYEHKRETGEFSFGFVFGVFVLIICLFFSRIIYIYFDFVLTKFNSEVYHLMPNILMWKLGTMFSTMGYAIFIFITDRKILGFKLKGLIAYLLIGIVIIQLVYPVSTPEDFQTIAMLDLFSNAIAIIIPILFIYLAREKSPYRLASLAIAIGVILYAIGSNMIVEPILVALIDVLGSNIRLVFYFFSLILKVSGLVLFTYGVTQFAIKFSR